ncbi:MAG: DUF1036 domain-containing protein [Bdellovibrionales bacterium]|jgi:uncharacterized membrane protein
MILQPFYLFSMAFVRSVLFLAVLLLSVALSSAAQAAFLFCNQTGVAIEAAFGHREENIWISEGWWQIQPGQCSRVYNKPLSQRFYFYYAHALAAPSKNGKEPMVWAGKYSFCADTKAFRAEGDDCAAQHYQTKGFQEVDVGVRQKDYTLTFRGEDGQ